MSTENLENRLRIYACFIGVSPQEVVSIKLRPVMPNAQYSDPLKYKDGNAYMYDSEYKVGKKATSLLKPTCALVEALTPTVDHPHPWGEPHIWRMENTLPDGRDVLWIQHETGLEILGDIAAVIAIAKAIAELYEVVRCKIQANKQDQNSDRHYKDEVQKLRLETRRIDSSGTVIQALVIRHPVGKTSSTQMLIVEIVKTLK